MTITATCGHQIPDNSEKYSVTIKGYNKEMRRCLDHITACLNCQKKYTYWGDILDTEAEEQAWVRYDD